MRDFGILLDSRLSMSIHVNNIITKSYRNLGFLMHTCQPFKNILSYKIVYYAYVRSVLEYVCQIWSPYYAVHINRLERVKKKLSHLNYKFRNPCGNYINNCRKYKLLTLEEKRVLMDMGFLFDVIRGRIDSPELLAHIKFNTPFTPF